MALFRLLWRPMAVVYLFLPLMATAWPVLRLEEAAGGPFFALWNEGTEPLVQSVRWQLAVLVPAALGLFSVLVRIEVLGSGLAWLLPGIRRGWLVGELILMLPFVAALGLLGASGASPEIGVAAAGVGLLAFNLPHLILLTGLRPWTGWVSLGGLIAAAVFPMQFGAIAVTTPFLTAVVAGGAALWIFGVRFSDRVAREMGPGVVDRDRNRFLKRFGARGEWQVDLTADRLAPWLLAYFYESGFGSLRRIIWMKLASAGFIVALTYAFVNYRMLLLWVGMMGGDATFGPSGGTLLYPLSRQQRARLRILSLLVEGAIVLVLLIGGSWLLNGLPLPIERYQSSTETSVGLGIVAAVAVAYLPIALWARVRSPGVFPPTAGRTVQSSLAFYLVFLVYTVIALLVALPLQRAWDAGSYHVAVGSLVLTALLLYPLFWYATLRHYRRCDLAASP